MADIKLYQIRGGEAKAKAVVDFKYEREIQKLCEQNLETFFGIPPRCRKIPSCGFQSIQSHKIKSSNLNLRLFSIYCN
jgi:hypothetical protein